MTYPSGTVTFLFTDIEGSTKLAQEYPEALPALLARHHAILNQAIQSNNGYVFQIVGDSFAVAFHFADEALQAALEAQRLLQSEAWTPAPIKVRMGIHTGAAHLKADNQYSGYATLASTQRIMSAGHGGQILLSAATRELVRGSLPVDAELLDMGEKRLKDLLRPEHLYQLTGAGLPAVFPPLQTLEAFPNNLPVPLTSFIGRENEIAEVKQELEGHRLVTLTGSGGTGKTRLSLQVAVDLLEKFDQGVWFVELAPLTDPDLIPQAVLAVIGIPEQQSRSPLEVLKEFLRAKRVLLVLDNCEHLVAASAQVANALLNAAPQLKILASSREALGVKGELAYPVPSLSLPDMKHLPLIEQLSQYEAVRLFIDRALLAAPHFTVSQENAPAIAQICYRLDGIPLAIELAAARVKMLSVEQISRRLDDRFRLLTGGVRTALPRQQTLRALIDWSYDLLSESERLLLRRLSVFMGGWTLEAAEEVCAGEGVEMYAALDLLTQLVNKSLVVVLEPSQSSEPRYRMLETIRQYAREKLLEAGGSETLRDKHLAYFVKLTEQAEPELIRSNQVFWVNKLEEELDNFRTAMDWALTTNPKAGLRLLLQAGRFWEERGDVREIESWLAQLLKNYPEVDALRARALVLYGSLLAPGDFTQAERLAQEGLHLARLISDQEAEAFCLWALGGIVAFQGDVRRGTAVMEESLALYRSLGDKFGQATTIMWLSVNNNDMERSQSLLLEGLKLYRDLGHLSGMAACLSQLMRYATWQADFLSAARWAEEAGALDRQLGKQSGNANMQELLGVLAYWQGDYQQACAHFEESIAWNEKLGYAWTYWPRVHRAYAELRQGQLAQARETYRIGIHQIQKANNMGALVYALEGLASLHVNQGQLERAAQLLAWAEARRDELGDHRPPVEQGSVDSDLAVIRSKVNEAEYAKLCAEGRTLTAEQAIGLALEA